MLTFFEIKIKYTSCYVAPKGFSLRSHSWSYISRAALPALRTARQFCRITFNWLGKNGKGIIWVYPLQNHIQHSVCSVIWKSRGCYCVLDGFKRKGRGIGLPSNFHILKLPKQHHFDRHHVLSLLKIVHP